MQASLQIQKIHERALQVSSNHRQSEIELISLLQEMDKCRGYLYFEANSLFDYANRILQLSEATSSNLINVARKSIEVPALKEAIENGALSVSKARKIIPVLTIENQNAWIMLATQNTTREIERAVAKEKPELAVKESARFITEDRLELTFGISDVNYKKLKRVCDLESQRTAKPINQESAIAAALEAYLEKFDPIRAAERSAKRKARARNGAEGETRSKVKSGDASIPVATTTESEFESTSATSAALNTESTTAFAPQGDAQRVTGHTPKIVTKPTLSRALIHQINIRDGWQCTYQTSQGLRCTNRRWLEFHHILPRAAGGLDNLENLKTLCSTHHHSIHQH